MIRHLLLLGTAGALGTLARFGVYEIANRLPTVRLPLATLFVNTTGSFLFGLIWMLADQGRLSQETRVVALAGFMGAFTTFSTFSFETGEMLSTGRYAAAAANIAANNVLAITALLIGLAVGRG